MPAPGVWGEEMNETVARVMRYCNNYSAVLAERVSGAVIDTDTVAADFAGKYEAGMLLRIHGAYKASYEAFKDGDLYEVVSYSDGVLKLDRELHTKAPHLLIVYCEPQRDFLDMCAEIEAYEAEAKGREGLASESIDGYSWSAGQGGTGFAAAFADKLGPYRCAKPTELYYARNALQWR